MKDINKKLSTIQAKLNVPKNQVNKFGNYKYRSAEDILEAVKPLLGDAVLTISDTMKLIGDRYYVKATATLSIDDTEKVSVNAYARESETKKGMDDAQITGSASSYARKYALNGLFCIDDTKDSDFTNTHGKTATATTTATTQADAYPTHRYTKFIEKLYKANKLSKIAYHDCLKSEFRAKTLLLKLKKEKEDANNN